MSEEKIDAYTVYATTDYVDEQLNSANSSKLISHVLPIEATEENQTIFPINLETFDAANDTVLVQDGITLLLPNSGFIVENNTIVMTTPWGLGDTGSILILKNTPILADEVAISGAVIENNSITLDKLSADITTELDEIKKSASDGKALVAGAITDKGIETAADATFETMAANVESIVTLDSAPGLEAATWTPGTTDQVISAGNYLRGDQTIKGDANLVAANIAKGKSLFGVTGTYDPAVTPEWKSYSGTSLNDSMFLAQTATSMSYGKVKYGTQSFNGTSKTGLYAYITDDGRGHTNDITLPLSKVCGSKTPIAVAAYIVSCGGSKQAISYEGWIHAVINFGSYGYNPKPGTNSYTTTTFNISTDLTTLTIYGINGTDYSRYFMITELRFLCV